MGTELLGLFEDLRGGVGDVSTELDILESTSAEGDPEASAESVTRVQDGIRVALVRATEIRERI